MAVIAMLSLAVMSVTLTTIMAAWMEGGGAVIRVAQLASTFLGHRFIVLTPIAHILGRVGVRAPTGDRLSFSARLIFIQIEIIHVVVGSMAVRPTRIHMPEMVNEFMDEGVRLVHIESSRSDADEVVAILLDVLARNPFDLRLLDADHGAPNKTHLPLIE